MNGKLNRKVGFFQSDSPLTLENGKTLYKPQTVYETYGTLNEDASNVIS